MTDERLTPGALQRLGVLWKTVNRERLAAAGASARRGKVRVLFKQIMMHTSYRWRLQNGLGTAAPVIQEVAPVSAAANHHEEDWPADRPLVSVIIPCFNYGAYVAEAVDSVLAQTLTDLEVIVVEGGSNDGTTPAILRNLRRPRTTILFRNQPHRVGDNRNFGISQARGRYICCLDADDMLRPTYLEKAVFLLEQCGYDVVSTSVRRFGAVEDTYGVPQAPELSDMLAGNPVTTCAVFRRSQWAEVGGYQDVDPGMPYLFEDWRFWIRLASIGARFRNVTGEYLFLYRAHRKPSLSTNVLPIGVQAGQLQELERDRITGEALARSRQRSQLRLRAPAGPRNLLARDKHGARGRTILLAAPFLVLGGAERLLSENFRYLRSIGYRLIVVSTLANLPEQGDTTAWFEESTDEIYHLPRFLASSEWDDFIDYVVVAKQVDAIWITGSAVFYEALPRLRKRFAGLRVIDLLFNTIGHTANNRRYAHLIDLIMVENQEVHDWLLARGETADRIRVIPSGIDLDRYSPALRSRTLAESIGIGADGFVVGCSGRLSEEKSPLAVFDIARQLADTDKINFVMTGGGPLEQQVSAAASSFCPPGRVHFAGIVPDIRDWLACYDVLLLPSAFDGRPTVVLEALAMGIPVVASAVGGLPELVQDGETGFLCRPGDHAGFARAIARLRADPVLHARMRVAARRFAERELKMERMTEAYATALDEVFCHQNAPLQAIA